MTQRGSASCLSNTAPRLRARVSPWKPRESRQHVPELVLPHVVDIQGLFPLGQDPEFHLPTGLPLPTLLFCLEGEEYQTRDGTWRLNPLRVLQSRSVAPPHAKSPTSALLPQTQGPRRPPSSLRHRSTGRGCLPLHPDTTRSLHGQKTHRADQQASSPNYVPHVI